MRDVRFRPDRGFAQPLLRHLPPLSAGAGYVGYCMSLCRKVELCSLLLVLAWGVRAEQTAVGLDPGVQMMNEAQRQAVQLLTLPDEDYFAFDQARTRAAQLQLANLFKISSRPAPTASPSDIPMFVALGAPRQLDVARHGELPVLIALRYTGQREWEAHYKQNIWLLVTDLESGATHIGYLFHADKRERTPQPSRSGTPPDPINARGVRTSLQRIDLRRAIARDWQPGRFAVTVIFYDWKSNTAVVELQGVGNVAKPLPIGQSSSFLTAIDSSLAPATTDGATFTLQSGAGQASAVNLAFDLPRDNQLLLIDREKRTPLLKATLLLLQLDDKWPVQIDLLMPVSLLKSASGESRLQGAVQFDLRAATERTLTGAYQAYLLAGDRVIGPWSLLLD